jgi:hypothetical protein
MAVVGAPVVVAVVQCFQIIGTEIYVIQALEPRTNHTTIEDVDGHWFGHVGTRALPAELDALPALSEERSKKVGGWHQAQYAEALAMIEATFPGAVAASFMQFMGSIQIELKNLEKIVPDMRNPETGKPARRIVRTLHKADLERVS